MMSRQDFFSTQGKVTELLRNKSFLVECNNGKVITATIAARFRTSSGRRKSKIIQGDKVIVEIPLRDPEKGEIVSFAEEKKWN